jgi:hypothetical protein
MLRGKRDKVLTGEEERQPAQVRAADRRSGCGRIQWFHRQLAKSCPLNPGRRGLRADADSTG